MAKQKRRRFTEQQKTGSLKRHLVDKTKVSDLCDELNIQPTQFYAWQKQLFENGTNVFEKNTKTSTISASEAKIKRRQQPLHFCRTPDCENSISRKARTLEENEECKWLMDRIRREAVKTYTSSGHFHLVNHSNYLEMAEEAMSETASNYAVWACFGKKTSYGENAEIPGHAEKGQNWHKNP